MERRLGLFERPSVNIIKLYFLTLPVAGVGFEPYIIGFEVECSATALLGTTEYLLKFSSSSLMLRQTKLEPLYLAIILCLI